MTKLEVPRAVRWIARTLEEAGFETWSVGGAVRDALRGATSEDWDLATRATPAEVKNLFRRTVPIGIDHGTMGVLSRDGVLYEVTTFRRDVETTGRHAVVEFSDSIDEDLARRDFTINAVAWHPLREVLLDPFDGQADLRKGVLKTVGNPADRFAEDYLRVLRALRFAGTFGLVIEEETWKALVSAVPRTTILSPERIRDELERILGGKTPPSRSLALYGASGVLCVLFPELDALVGLSRSAAGDWFTHSLHTVDALSSHRPALRWAALFQGLGEPGGSLGEVDEGGDRKGRTLRRSVAVLERLRSSNAAVREVASLASWISDPPEAHGSDEALRRWLAGVGRAALNPLLRIWIASFRVEEARQPAPGSAKLLELFRRVRALARSGAPLAVEELALSGRDLIQMGYRPGPKFGEALEHLLDRTLAHPELNTKDSLRSEVREWMEKRRESQ